jgi:hypothetical protein
LKILIRSLFSGVVDQRERPANSGGPPSAISAATIKDEGCNRSDDKAGYGQNRSLVSAHKRLSGAFRSV